MAVTDKRLSSLQQACLALFRSRFHNPRPTEKLQQECLLFHFPAASRRVGPVDVEVDQEITVIVGRHTHSHFSPELFPEGSPDEIEAEVCEMAASYLEELFANRVVVWSEREPNGGVRGGSFSLDAGHPLPPKAKAYFWSGTPFLGPRAAGA